MMLGFTCVNKPSGRENKVNSSRITLLKLQTETAPVCNAFSVEGTSGASRHFFNISVSQFLYLKVKSMCILGTL